MAPRQKGQKDLLENFAPGPSGKPIEPLPCKLPPEIWLQILGHLGISDHCDPSDYRTYDPESLEILLKLRQTYSGFENLVQPLFESLSLSDLVTRRQDTLSFADRVDRLQAFSLRHPELLAIPMTAYLKHGLRLIKADPSEEVLNAKVMNGFFSSGQWKQQFRPNRLIQGIQNGSIARAVTDHRDLKRSAPTSSTHKEVTLQWRDLLNDGNYRAKLDALKLEQIDQLWRIMEEAWSSVDEGSTRNAWAAPLTTICKLNLPETAKHDLLVDKVWPKLKGLSIAARSEPLTAFIKNRGLPSDILSDALTLLNESHKSNCLLRSHAEGLGAIAIHLNGAPLEDRLATLDKLIGESGALFDLPPEHLALALVPLANIDLADAADPDKRRLFSQVQILRELLPEGSEMFRLLPRRVDDTTHLLMRLLQMQHRPFNQEAPEDAMSGHFGNRLTLDDFLRMGIIFGDRRSRLDGGTGVSLDDFLNMLNIAEIGYLTWGGAGTPGYLQNIDGAINAQVSGGLLGQLKPEEIFTAVSAVIEAMQQTRGTGNAQILRRIANDTSFEGAKPREEILPLLKVACHDLLRTVTAIEQEIQSPETHNPREPISKLESVLLQRPDIQDVRAKMRSKLQTLVDDHPHEVADAFSDPKLLLKPLSDGWRKP